MIFGRFSLRFCLCKFTGIYNKQTNYMIDEHCDWKSGDMVC